MIGVQEAIRSDIGLYAGGITYVDDVYDERAGEALRPINQDFSGLPFGRFTRPELLRLLGIGAEKACTVAAPTLAAMYERMGFVRL